MGRFELATQINQLTLQVEAPSWEDIALSLASLRESTGSVALRPCVGACWPSLECLAEDGMYLLTLGELDEQGEVIVRTLTTPGLVPRTVSILGDCWDSRMITENFQHVIDAFQEFHRRGTVGDLLSE